MHDVQRTLIISVILVTLVVFVFLREVRATMIPSVAVPLAIVGTFGIMYLCGFSLNNLSLMALTISTGFVVDDAIVVLENVMRHVEGGMKPYQAALLGAREIGFTVVSMSTSLIAVFIPILLMGGIVGRLFREFAVTLSAAIAVSLVVSLTTTPMLCARFLKAHDPGSHGALYRMSESGWLWMSRTYKSTLGWVLRHKRLIFAVAILMVGVNVWLYIIVPKGFFPQQDTGRMVGMIMGDQDVSFLDMLGKTEPVHPHREERPRDPERHRVRGRRIRPEPGPHVRYAQTAGRAQDQRGPGHRPPSSQDVPYSRRDAVLPGSTGFANRRTHVQRPVPVHAVGRKPDRALRLGAQAFAEAAENSPAERREQRSAGQRPGRKRHHRSRHRLAPGHHAAAD